MTTAQPDPADSIDRERHKKRLDSGTWENALEQRKNETIDLVKLLSEIGPDISEISRRLRRSRESVRYCYEKYILKKGIAVQAKVDHEKLGLRRVIVVLDFAGKYKKFSQSILASMNELCFLVSFARTMPEDYYIASFSTPREQVDVLKRFLDTMKEKGMFSHLEILDFDWVRVMPMKAELYDFDSGGWDFDWTPRAASDFGSSRYTPSSPARFDYVDLLLIKELQIDPKRSLREISDKVEVNYGKLAWHHKEHVMARHLLSGYAVNWMGTRYDDKIEKPLHRQHRYLANILMIRGVTEYETIFLRQAFERLPFLWSEAAGANYFCEFSIPVDSNIEWLQYLTKAISAVKERAKIYAVDQSDAAAFTISYGPFNQTRKRWELSLKDLINKFSIVF